MIKFKFSHNGSILLITMIFMVVLIVLTTVFLNSVLRNQRAAVGQNDTSEALYLAEAGINMAIWYLKNTAPDNSTDGSWRTTAYSSSSTGSTYSSCTAGSCNPKTETLGDGTYTMWVETSTNNSISSIKITSKGIYNNLSKTIQVQTTSSPTSGLVGWWKFDEGSGASASDSSGNSNTGTLNNTPTWIAGKIGSGALTLNGSTQSIRVAHSASLNVSGSISISAWIKVSAHNSSYREILRKAAGGYGWFFLLNTSNKLSMSTSASDQPSEYTGGYAYAADSAWHMVTSTFNGSTITLYLDGALMTTLSGGALNQNTDPLYIGSLGGSSQFFSGSIDDVRVYNRALSSSEVNQLYQGSQVISVIPSSWTEL